MLDEENDRVSNMPDSNGVVEKKRLAVVKKGTE
jgi:hypothetical protein